MKWITQIIVIFSIISGYLFPSFAIDGPSSLNMLQKIEVIPSPKKSLLTVKLCFTSHPKRKQWKVISDKNSILVYLYQIGATRKLSWQNKTHIIDNILVKQIAPNANLVNIVLKGPAKNFLKSVCYDYLDDKKLALILHFPNQNQSTANHSRSKTLSSTNNVKELNSNSGLEPSLDAVRKEILAEKEENSIEEILNRSTSQPQKVSSQISQKQTPELLHQGIGSKIGSKKNTLTPDQSLPSHSNLPTSPLGALFKSFSVLLVVIGSILLSLWGWKKLLVLKQKKLGINKNFMKILAVHHFSPKQIIALVEIAGQKLVLGITPTQITTLMKLDSINESPNRSKMNNKIGIAPSEFALNLQQETAKVEQTMSKAVEVLQKKMEQLKKI